MIPNWFKEVPEHLKTQEMCNKAVEKGPSWMLEYVPDHFVTQEMCNKAVQSKPWALEYVPDHFVTQEMCNKAMQRDPEVLRFVTDWFVTLQEMWYEEFDDELITWRHAYIKRKTQKAQIKKKLMPVAWHPDRWWNWCVPEGEKQELEIYFS